MTQRIRMSITLDPGLLRDLTEAKAALARHGIVIIRTIETELEPAIMAEARDSVASSSRKLAKLKEDELDRFMEDLRKASMKSAKELASLYTRLLAKLGTEYLGDLVKELEGIDQLFKWSRIEKAAEPVNEILVENGFRKVQLGNPEDLSDAFKVELEEKWNSAFVRFRLIAEQAVEEMKRQDANERSALESEKRKRPSRKR
ncbi:MAG: hypothetical protein NTY62_02750 [Euryarchaeota archaeon]|nr:hypothetical protein [Euryarchaeota archaeon]